MIVTEIIDDYKFTFSDSGYQIQKVGTDEIYDSAYDTLDSDYTYVETENLIENNPLNELYLTRGDVFRGLYMAKGITRNQIRAMIDSVIIAGFSAVRATTSGCFSPSSQRALP